MLRQSILALAALAASGLACSRETETQTMVSGLRMVDYMLNEHVRGHVREPASFLSPDRRYINDKFKMFVRENGGKEYVTDWLLTAYQEVVQIFSDDRYQSSRQEIEQAIGDWTDAGSPQQEFFVNQSISDDAVMIANNVLWLAEVNMAAKTELRKQQEEAWTAEFFRGHGREMLLMEQERQSAHAQQAAHEARLREEAAAAEAERQRRAAVAAAAAERRRQQAEADRERRAAAERSAVLEAERQRQAAMDAELADAEARELERAVILSMIPEAAHDETTNDVVNNIALLQKGTEEERQIAQAMLESLKSLAETPPAGADKHFDQASTREWSNGDEEPQFDQAAMDAELADTEARELYRARAVLLNQIPKAAHDKVTNDVLDDIASLQNGTRDDQLAAQDMLETLKQEGENWHFNQAAREVEVEQQWFGSRWRDVFGLRQYLPRWLSGSLTAMQSSPSVQSVAPETIMESPDAPRHLQYKWENGLEGPFDVPGTNNNCMFHSVGHALDELLLGTDTANDVYAHSRYSRWAPHLRNMAEWNCEAYVTRMFDRASARELCGEFNVVDAMGDQYVAGALSDSLGVVVAIYAWETTARAGEERKNPVHIPNGSEEDAQYYTESPRVDIRHSGLHYGFYRHSAPNMLDDATRQDIVTKLLHYQPS